MSKNNKLKKTARQVWTKMPLVNKGWEILFNKNKSSEKEIELERV